MFDFSLGKLLIVGVIALIVLGPDKLPGAARTVGAMIRRLRSGWDSVRAEVERELEIEEIRSTARKAAADAEAAQAEASSTLKNLRSELDKVREAKSQLDEAVRAPLSAAADAVTDNSAASSPAIEAATDDGAADAAASDGQVRREAN
ncbi:MAG TPA: Sec-independent protein translocase protein TatB [Oleiagrimonas sp.]|nr:Sec-independent protein translocase protein TatB [Oleiagrimonas sp.]